MVPMAVFQELHSKCPGRNRQLQAPGSLPCGTLVCCTTSNCHPTRGSWFSRFTSPPTRRLRRPRPSREPPPRRSRRRTMPKVPETTPSTPSTSTKSLKSKLNSQTKLVKKISTNFCPTFASKKKKPCKCAPFFTSAQIQQDFFSCSLFFQIFTLCRFEKRP